MDNWWLDYCCDESRANAPGLTPDTWINTLYAQRQHERGLRWLPLARVGSSMFDPSGAGPGVWAEHRDAIHFTGDTFATWPMLDFQTRFTAAEGAGVGMPYVSHDIGSFHGQRAAAQRHVPALDSVRPRPADPATALEPRAKAPVGVRRPAGSIAALFLRLRESLVPYLYTTARQAYDSGLPIAGRCTSTGPSRATRTSSTASTCSATSCCRRPSAARATRRASASGFRPGAGWTPSPVRSTAGRR